MEKALSEESSFIPLEWMVSRWCEEFNTTPDIAIDLPFGLTSRIMALRDYVAARQEVKDTKPSDLKKTHSIERVLLTQARLAGFDGDY